MKNVTHTEAVSRSYRKNRMSSCQYSLHHLGMFDSGQADIETGVAGGQTLAIESHHRRQKGSGLFLRHRPQVASQKRGLTPYLFLTNSWVR